MTVVHLVLPGDIDDPAVPSGGNVYDRRISHGLAALGWQVHEHPVPGLWPTPTFSDRSRLAGVLSGMPEGSVVLIDGLVASAVPEVLAPQSARLRLVVVVHMPLEDAAEGEALAAAQAVVTTSEWTRGRLLELYPLLPQRIHAAPPGADPMPLAPGSLTGQELLCVAAVTLLKGHDILADALTRIDDLSWNCVCAGALTREPQFVTELAPTLPDRMRLVGPLAGQNLDTAYARSDLLVLPSRGETYGMVITEALARGIPVLATNTKGIPEALGRAPDGRRPGILVKPGDPAALAAALRHWLTNAGTRQQLRESALARRTTLTGWEDTAARIAKVLT